MKSQFAKKAPEGGRCFEGERYRLWQKEGILTITAKDNRGEILRLENGGIGGYLQRRMLRHSKYLNKAYNKN
ncbi:hypothetical protein [Nostoc sp.]|uniref:hypothetical protein n=1 Tax=Nostoc sp. TaxID=1180 RepID=UPI002FFC34C1